MADGRVAATRAVIIEQSGRVPSPVVLLEAQPLAVLLLPVVLLPSVESPTAVFWKPTVLLTSAESPTAVLTLPLVLLQRARAPTAVLPSPLVSLKSAAPPMAVFRLARHHAKERPGTYRRIELAVPVALERKPPNRRVVNASREA